MSYGEVTLHSVSSLGGGKGDMAMGILMGGEEGQALYDRGYALHASRLALGGDQQLQHAEGAQVQTNLGTGAPDAGQAIGH